MKHFSKLILATFLLPLFTVAQTNYKPGYVVKLKGDTLHGFIDYKDWGSNPTAISFKSTLSDRNKQTFTLSDISFFTVNDLAAYKKYVCSISMDVTNMNNMRDGRDTSFRVDTVFLKILQKGEHLALYSYTDDTKTRFYISEAPDYAPTELVFRLYFDLGKQGSGRTVYENTYLKQLFAFANKYHALDDKLSAVFEKAGYNKGDLLTIASRINNISDAEYDKKYAEHSKIAFFASAAVNISTTSSASSSSYTLGGGKSYTSYLPAVSAGIRVVPNTSSGRIEFRGSVLFAEIKFNPLYTLKVSPYVPVKATYDQLNISLLPEIIYNFYNAENLKIFMGFGVDVAYFKYSNAALVSQNPSISVSNIEESETYHFNNFDSSFFLKAGAQFNRRFEIFATYYTTMSSTQGGYFQLNENSIDIGLGYLFGK